nr:unnamed protein product [Callosobruchus analis]
MVHAQAAHMLNIYELGIPNNGRCASPVSPRDNNSPEKDNQKRTAMDTEEENGDVDHDFMENGRDGLTGTPDSATSRNDKELEELMASAARVMEGGGGANGIMHALSVVSAATPAAQPGASPPPLAAATAPMVVAQVASTSTTAVAAEAVAPKTY